MQQREWEWERETTWSVCIAVWACVCRNVCGKQCIIYKHIYTLCYCVGAWMTVLTDWPHVLSTPANHDDKKRSKITCSHLIALTYCVFQMKQAKCSSLSSTAYCMEHRVLQMEIDYKCGCWHSLILMSFSMQLQTLATRGYCYPHSV